MEREKKLIEAINTLVKDERFVKDLNSRDGYESPRFSEILIFIRQDLKREVREKNSGQ